ncbi:MAG: thioredoxin [Anaerolineaceae bacterium]|nr:thioredoxin [Anaerolineaceae bacterium]
MHSSNIVELNSSNFQSLVLDAELPVLVDFGADWCPPCRMLEPIVDQIADAYAGQMRVGSVNADDYPDLQIRYGVMGLPTLILFQNGEPIHHMIGYQPRQRIEAQIKPLLTPVTNG